MPLPALALYLAVALPVALANADRLNPDGVCYLRLAQYLAAGNWADGISLYWSPALPLSVAPLVALGWDALDAGRMIMVAWGGALIVATGWLLREWIPLSRPWRAAWLTLLVLPVTGFQMFAIVPDVVLSTILLAYFAALRRASRCGGGWVLAGALGGAAFLAKAYALPFVALHLPATVWWLHRHRPDSSTWSCGRALAIALAAFLVPVAAWTTALSVKNGSITLGKSGSINHAVAGPPDVVRYHPIVFGVPEPPHVSVWETPEQLTYQVWSPLASREYFLHQIGLAAENARELLRTTFSLDGIDLGGRWRVGLLTLGALALPFLMRRTRVDETKFWLGSFFPWLAGTMLLYAGGYLLVAFEPRYVRSLFLPLLLAATAGAAAALPAPRWRAAIFVALAGSIAWTWIPVTVRSLNAPSSRWLREVVAELQKRGLEGRFASTSWAHGVATAFFSGQPHVGFPPDANPARVRERLREARVDCILIFQFPSMPPQPLQDLYPPTIPRAFAVVTEENWEARAALAIRQPEGEVRVFFFHRPTAVASP